MKKTLNRFWIVICLISPFISVAQNFSNGFNFNLPHNDTTPSVFLPNFPQKWITEAQRVSVQGDNFIVSNQPIKFWGVNLTTAACFPLKENASKMAGRMRKMGINLVRFHHMDNPWSDANGTIFDKTKGTRTLNATTLDRLEFLIAELKRNNIYSNINLNVSRTFTTQDGIAGADSLKDFGKGVTIFDPQMIALQKEYARQLLTHISPYTNSSLVNEPAVAMVEMINENSLYGMWKDDALKNVKEGGNLLYRHVAFLDSAWNSFLNKKYASHTALQAAWANTNIITPVERIQNGGFENATLGSNWQNEQHNGATATFTVDATQRQTGNQSAKIQVTNTSGTDWHAQFKYVNFSFKKDSNYVLKFAAKADKSRLIGVGLMRNDAPYTWYGGQSFNLTTDWQTFQISFTATEDIVNTGRISFSVGHTTGSIWLDNVSFAEPTIQVLDNSENLASKNIRRIGYGEKTSYSKQRVADLAEFYIQLQKSFMEDLRLFLKNDLGVKVPITGTNALVGIQEGLEHENMDYYDDHNYWDHPWFPVTAWDINNWLIQNKSPLKESRLPAITNALTGIGLADKPFTVSEYNQPFPNRYRSEMAHEWAAYGSFHGLDGLMFFEYSGDSETKASLDFVPGYFNTARDPSVMALFPSCAWAFRNGLISPALKPIKVNYTRSDIYNSFEKDNQGRWGKYVPYNLALQLTHSIRTQSYNSSTPYTPSVLPTPSNTVFETDTKETSLNTTQGVLTTQTPRFIAVTGFLNALSNVAIGNLTLQSSSDFGSLTWVSLNQKNLLDSDTTLLTLSSRTQNTGMIWNADNTSVSNNWGTSPTQVFPLNTALRLNIVASSIDLFTLNPLGQVISSKNIKPVSNNIFELNLAQSTDKTLWYGIVARRALPTQDIHSKQYLKISPNPASHILNVKYTSYTEGGALTIDIMDISGKIVLSRSLDNYSLGLEKSLDWDISTLRAGLYIVKMGAVVQKLVVEKE